jgi:predicted dehydrogenase
MQGLTNITHVEGRFYKDSSPDFYGGCASAFTCDVVHVIDLIRHLAGCPTESAVTMETTDGDSAHAWYSLIRFKNGISGVVRSNYRTGGRVHEFELHGPGASAYINLGFGDAEISARILRGAGGYSLSAANMSNPDIIEFDGVKLGGVGYERYYGYYDEDKNFVESALGLVSTESAAERLREDYETMELVQLLLDSRI